MLQSPATPDALIRLEGVTKEYPLGEVTVTALADLDLAIPAGELVVLLGPSGCGKTTALNLIGGLDRPTKGRVVVDGDDITAYDDGRLTRYRRDTVGFVFQFFNLIPTLTAAENVEFALELTHHDALRPRALELLERVGLRDRADHFPAQLSGGQQQRVAIARALANDPPVLLCDEPTGNLDATTGQQVLQVIQDMNRQGGTTVVLVTHNVAIALLADRVVRLQSGAVERIDVPTERHEAAELRW